MILILFFIGFASFGGTTEILSLKVVEGYPTYIAVELVIALNNPSNITITAGNLDFNVVMDASGSVVGYVQLPQAVIKPGRNEMKANMKMTSTDLVSLATLLSNYLTGKNTPLTVQGTPTSTSIVPLQYGLSQLKLKTNLQGIPPTLVVETQLDLVLGIIPYIYVKFSNPLDTPYTVRAVDSTVMFTSLDGKYLKLGTLKGSFSPAVTVPAKGTAVNEKPLTLTPDVFNLAAFFAIPDGKRIVDLTQTVTVTVGSGFNGAFMYEQKGVPVVNYGGKAQVLNLNSTSLVSSAIPATSSIISSTTLLPSTTDSSSTETTTVTATTASETSSTVTQDTTTTTTIVQATTTTEAHVEAAATASSTSSAAPAA